MNRFMILCIVVFCHQLVQPSKSQGASNFLFGDKVKNFTSLEEMFENTSEESNLSMETGGKVPGVSAGTFELGTNPHSHLQSFDLKDFGFSFDSKMSYRGTNIKGSVIGLANMGNTCYLNSLTVMFAVTKLQEILSSKARISMSGDESDILAKLNLKEAMHSLIMGMNNQVTYGHTERTQRYLKVLGGILASKMEGSLFMQHDPSEIYTHIMQELESELNGFEALVGEKIVKKGTTDINYMENHQKFIPLPLMKGKKLQVMIDKFFSTEVIKTDPTNPKATVYHKTTKLLSAPSTLIFQLLRFGGMWGEQKDKSQIKVPLHIVVKVFHPSHWKGIRSRVQRVPYHLKSAIVHLGGSRASGHYVAYSFHKKNKQVKAIRYDDNIVEVVPKGGLEKLHTNGYFLAYEKS